jgi:hypothetical protein
MEYFHKNPRFLFVISVSFFVLNLKNQYSLLIYFSPIANMAYICMTFSKAVC